MELRTEKWFMRKSFRTPQRHSFAVFKRWGKREEKENRKEDKGSENDPENVRVFTREKQKDKRSGRTERGARMWDSSLNKWQCNRIDWSIDKTASACRRIAAYRKWRTHNGRAHSSSTLSLKDRLHAWPIKLFKRRISLAFHLQSKPHIDQFRSLP